jgi:hypothetical protein
VVHLLFFDFVFLCLWPDRAERPPFTLRVHYFNFNNDVKLRKLLIFEFVVRYDGWTFRALSRLSTLKRPHESLNPSAQHLRAKKTQNPYYKRAHNLEQCPLDFWVQELMTHRGTTSGNTMA